MSIKDAKYVATIYDGRFKTIIIEIWWYSRTIILKLFLHDIFKYNESQRQLQTLQVSYNFLFSKFKKAKTNIQKSIKTLKIIKTFVSDRTNDNMLLALF